MMPTLFLLAIRPPFLFVSRLTTYKAIRNVA